jgi:hypothetical protein
LSGKESFGDAAKELAKEAGSQIRNRLNSHYFVYVLTSLISFNWQHILVITMSKWPIENILKTWAKEENFAVNYFWVPVVVGYVASIILPALAIPVAWITSLIAENVNAGDEWAKARIQIFKKSLETKKDKKTNEALLAKLVLDEHENNIKKLRSEILIMNEQKEMLIKYLEDLRDVYQEVPEVYDIKDFERFFELAKEKGLAHKYPANSIVNLMLERVYYLRGGRETPPSKEFF